MADAPAVSRPLDPSRRLRLPRVGAVDPVGLEARAAALATRSVEGEAKLWALVLVVRATELAALEPAATPRRVEELCARAVRPDPSDGSIPPVAAVCVRPELAAVCRERLDATGVRVVSVGAGALGVDEVELPFDSGAFLSGRTAAAFDGIAAAREAVAPAALRVALDADGIGGYEALRRATLLAAVAGADIVATTASVALLPVALCVLEAIRDVGDETGRSVGFKAAGVASAGRAVQLAVLVYETLGIERLTPDRFRIGGTGLLNDVLTELRVQRSGVYQAHDLYAPA